MRGPRPLLLFQHVVTFGMSADSFQHHFADLRTRVEVALREILDQQPWPAALKEAVDYSLMAGGKRLRPVLVLMAVEVCEGDVAAGISAACAIEMIHTYSLIHDDLPSMDDDDLRRGRPTSHRVFGEALAILAGDALLTLAFESLSAASGSASVTLACLRILARAAGGQGMVGGQILDLEAERGVLRNRPRLSPELQGEPLSSRGRKNEQKTGASPEPESIDATVGDSEGILSADSPGPADFQESSQDDLPIAARETAAIRVEQLVQIHRMKTGALLTAALEMGAALAEAAEEQRSRLVRFGQCIGLAFQIADDLLDVTGAGARLGKVTGRDEELGKLTYPCLIGIEASRDKALTLIEEACDALSAFDGRADSLRQLARFIVERDH